jgi:HSP20 family protein
MTRTMRPWLARVPRLLDFEMDFPRWMTDVFGPESGFGREGEFLPETNFVETDKALEVTVELPGMRPEEVKVEVKDKVLWISGEKKEEKKEKGKTFHRMERRTGTFRRVFSLPVDVMDDRVEARFVDGVLKITLPKSEKVAAKKIEVKS